MVTVDSLKNKEVVVYGTGINAVKCTCFLERRGITISYMVDGREGTGKFKDYSVQLPSPQALDGKYIIVACAAETYGQIKARLSAYQEFEQFIYYGWLDKKMVFLHGNCHMDIIESCLISSGKFKSLYAIYPTPRVCDGEILDETALINMDIWIHEDIRSDNKFGYKVSDAYVSQFMKDNIFEITIPHLYGLGAGFFPHAKETNDKNTTLLNGAYGNGMFPFRDDVIDRCVTEDMDIDRICKYVYEDNIIPAEYIINNFNEYVGRIRKREKAWDIKILDFILEHYKTEKLFYDIGHPVNAILEWVSVEILKLLNIQDEVSTDKKLDYHEVPVYPWIGKVLGMDWTEREIRTDVNAIKCGDSMDIAEYVREYIWWCYA